METGERSLAGHWVPKFERETITTRARRELKTWSFGSGISIRFAHNQTKLSPSPHHLCRFSKQPPIVLGYLERRQSPFHSAIIINMFYVPLRGHSDRTTILNSVPTPLTQRTDWMVGSYCTNIKRKPIC